jgi:hypothetical protein
MNKSVGMTQNNQTKKYFKLFQSVHVTKTHMKL